MQRLKFRLIQEEVQTFHRKGIAVRQSQIRHGL